jgi:ADP-dependent NAD(P)H-hydrate dehydratase / NAD(P)H-hydrate epimerase
VTAAEPAATGLAHAVDDVRAAEAAVMAALPPGALMQRAAAGLAAACARELAERRGRVSGARVLLLVGGGDNGGDALFAGSRLAGRGARVDAVLVGGRAHEAGLAALRRAGGRDLTPGEGVTGLAGRADLVVDGILGIGGRGGLREPAADVVAAVAAARRPGVPVVAVDLPSGTGPDDGTLPGPHVQADVTVTFGTLKPGLLLPPADAAAGRLHLVDIGLRPHLPAPAVERLDETAAAAAWPVPGPHDDKYSRGVVGVVAGGATYTGAAVLATGAAVRAGAGMVRYLGPAPATELVRGRWPEVVPGPGRVQAWVLGPGVDPADAGQTERVDAALDEGVPCLVDAGGLARVAERVADGEPDLGDRPLLLTPHAGELARLLSRTGTPTERADVEARPLEHVRAAVRATGATVLLKGATTLVVAPDGRVRSQPHRPHWLATAGSGDVLAGVAGTLLAAGLDPLDAGSVAVVVHGLAGGLASGGGPVSAGAVADALPAAVARLLRRHGAALAD